MLGKLLKYEMPAVARKLLPLYIAWLATAVPLGLSTATVESKSDFFMAITAMLYMGVATAIFVMTVLIIIQGYSQSLLGDQAYFNQVLPVTAAEHVGNKLISALIWVVATGLVAILSVLLIGLSALIAGETINFADMELNIPKGSGVVIVELIILALASTCKSIMQIYTAITIGHQASSHTTLASIGAYIALLFVESMAGRVLMFVIPVLARMYVNAPEDFSQLEVMPVVFIPALIVTVALTAVYFFICKYLMEKRLNLA